MTLYRLYLSQPYEADIEYAYFDGEPSVEQVVRYGRLTRPADVERVRLMLASKFEPREMLHGYDSSLVLERIDTIPGEGNPRTTAGDTGT